MGLALRAHLETRSSTDIGSATSLFNGVRLSTYIAPATGVRGGGEWCEAFALSRDILALSIGDVSGHGPEQFEVTLLLRQAARDATHSGLDPAQALASMNRFVCDLERPTVATALLALLDTHRGIVTIASAGHQPPLLASRSRASFLSNAVGDLPLGVERTSVPTLTSARTPPATLLVLYTDGVIEHERQFLRGETQLRQAAMFAPRQSSRPIATLIADLTFKADGNNDDIAILAALMPSAPFPTAEVRGRGHSSKGATPLAMREWA